MSKISISGSVVLKYGKESPLLRYHPWVFSRAIERVEGAPEVGQWVSVVSAHGEILGYGHYQKKTIAVRILSFESQAPDENFWEKRIGEAYALRKMAIDMATTNAYRLAHGEGDELSGLILDIYHQVGVVQSHAEGMTRDRQHIAESLLRVLPHLRAVYFKNTHGHEPGDGYLIGSAEVPYSIMENSLTFYVDWVNGQKTGFFLDQRDNRALLGKYAHGRSVLNAFCYTGGFSVYALQNRAKLLHSVDASEKAIQLAQKNLEANRFSPADHPCFKEDVFAFMRQSREKYNLIILDPPAFAKHKESCHQAVKGYQRLNSEALKIIDTGGILFTFSCSQVVNEQLFRGAIAAAGIQVRRKIRILHHLSQPADHPASLFHPEGEYLKGLVLHVI